MERFPTTIKNIAHLSKLEHDPPIFVKALDPVVVGVNHDDVVLCVTTTQLGWMVGAGT